MKVAAVDFNGEMHAMVLESVKQITWYNRSPGYEIGDHKLVFKNTYDSKEYGKEKKFTINAEDEKAPESFYYVHIDVDLDQLEDWEESESDISDDEDCNSTESDQTESTDEEPEQKRRR